MSSGKALVCHAQCMWKPWMRWNTADNALLAPPPTPPCFSSSWTPCVYAFPFACHQLRCMKLRLMYAWLPLPPLSGCTVCACVYVRVCVCVCAVAHGPFLLSFSLLFALPLLICFACFVYLYLILLLAAPLSRSRWGKACRPSALTPCHPLPLSPSRPSLGPSH